jgi:hypothetical protein
MFRRIAGVVIISIAIPLAIDTPAQEPPAPKIPNLLIEISRDFANAAAGSQPIDQTTPIQEQRGRLQVCGIQNTRATLAVEFVPSANTAVMDLLLYGHTDADTRATQGPVSLYLTTRVSYAGRKRIFIDENGLHDLYPADSCPQLDENTLNCLQTKFRGPLDPMVRKIAYRVYNKKKAEVESDIIRDARKTVNQQFDTSAVQEFAKANDRYEHDVRGPMLKRGIFPQTIKVLSSSEQIGIRALLNDPTGQRRVFAKVPDIAGFPDIGVRVEESLLNNASHSIFAGKKFTGEQLEKEFTTLLKPITGDVKMMDVGDKPFSITFPKEKPIEIHFEKQTVKVTIRGAEFTSGDTEYDGMDTTAIYKLSKQGDGLVAERQGDLIIFPPGFVPGKDKLGAREQVLRKLLERKFGRVLKPKFVMDPIEMPDALRQTGILSPTQVESDNGWLVLGLRRIPRPANLPAPAKE